MRVYIKLWPSHLLVPLSCPVYFSQRALFLYLLKPILWSFYTLLSLDTFQSCLPQFVNIEQVFLDTQSSLLLFVPIYLHCHILFLKIADPTLALLWFSFL